MTVDDRRTRPHTVFGGRVVVTEILMREGVGDGMFRGHLVADPSQRRLVTQGGDQQRSHADLVRDLALAVPGVTALEFIGRVDADDGLAWGGTCMVEVEPAGVRAVDRAPLAEAAAVRIGLAVLDVLERAHASGVVLRGIRPEVVYLSADPEPVMTGLAPRADVFLYSARAPSSGRSSLWSRYRSGEDFIAQRPEPKSDVFALCATLFHLVSGQHPLGSDFPEQIDSIMAGRVRPWPGDPALGTVLLHGLQRDPLQRASVSELRAALRALT